jgi:intracellular multiplication protein IcmL
LRGWNTFAGSYVGQGNFEELKRARLLCHAQSQRAALIHQTSFVQGALAYTIEIPIVQTCENVNQVSTNNLLVTAVVVRTNADDHPDGLAIDQLVATSAH